MRGRNNSDILQNWFPPEITSTLFNLEKFQVFEKSLPDSWTMDWNLMNHEEFGSIELLRLKYRRGDQIIQTFYKIGSPQKFGPPSLICRNFGTLRSLPDSCRMDWNLMNDEEFRSIGLLRFKYRKGGQIIQTFCKTGSPQKLGPPSLICRKLKTLRKVLLNNTKCIES